MNIDKTIISKAIIDIEQLIQTEYDIKHDEYLSNMNTYTSGYLDGLDIAEQLITGYLVEQQRILNDRNK